MRAAAIATAVTSSCAVFYLLYRLLTSKYLQKKIKRGEEQNHEISASYIDKTDKPETTMTELQYSVHQTDNSSDSINKTCYYKIDSENISQSTDKPLIEPTTEKQSDFQDVALSPTIVEESNINNASDAESSEYFSVNETNLSFKNSEEVGVISKSLDAKCTKMEDINLVDSAIIKAVLQTESCSDNIHDSATFDSQNASCIQHNNEYIEREIVSLSIKSLEANSVDTLNTNKAHTSQQHFSNNVDMHDSSVELNSDKGQNKGQSKDSSKSPKKLEKSHRKGRKKEKKGELSAVKADDTSQSRIGITNASSKKGQASNKKSSSKNSSPQKPKADVCSVTVASLDKQTSDYEREASPDQENATSDSQSLISQASVDSGQGSIEVEADTLFTPGVKFQTSTQDNFIQYRFLLSPNLVGRLIGRKGSFVNKIKSLTSATVVVMDHTILKLCCVEGYKSDVNRALEMIRDHFPLSRFPEGRGESTWTWWFISMARR